ncbi:hypothetical protein HDU98_008045 [Podochytrium sp. JEL0797]|nr:hypothetical protein HDU98_008045 [Podochytrium sp. JEL0797]
MPSLLLNPVTSYTSDSDMMTPTTTRGGSLPPLSAVINTTPATPVLDTCTFKQHEASRMSISFLVNDDTPAPAPVASLCHMKQEIHLPHFTYPTSPPQETLFLHHTRQQRSLHYTSKLHYHRPVSMGSPDSTSPCESTAVLNAPPVFECTECGKTFSKKAYLKSHWVSHSDVSPHRCRLVADGNQCTKRFRRWQDMVRHERTVKH